MAIEYSRNRLVAGPARTGGVRVPGGGIVDESTGRIGLPSGVRTTAPRNTGLSADTGTDTTGEDTQSGVRDAGGFNIMIDWGDTRGGGGGSSRTGTRRYIENLIRTGEYRAGIPEFGRAVEESVRRQRAAAQENTAALLRELQGQYGRTQDILFGQAGDGGTRTGGTYGALRAYLEQNAPTAYATAQRAVAPAVENALAQYMTAQGTPTTGAEAAVSLANMLGQGSAENYNRLLGILQAAETSGQAGRLREYEQSRTFAEQQLLNALASRESQARLAEQQALSQIAANAEAQRLAGERAALERRQSLLSQLISLR